MNMNIHDQTQLNTDTYQFKIISTKNINDSQHINMNKIDDSNIAPITPISSTISSLSSLPISSLSIPTISPSPSPIPLTSSSNILVDLTCDNTINMDFTHNHNNDNYDHNEHEHEHVIEYKHCDFIVGRGRTELVTHMNLPLNPAFMTRNVIFIDADPNVNPDICQYIENVDFNPFGICNNQDPDEHIEIRIIFDWASFYCGAMQNLTDIVAKIGRKCQILVPLDKTENTIPLDVQRALNNNVFKISINEGYYPLFDWSLEGEDCLGINPMSLKPKIMSDIINPDRYMIIYCNN